MLCYARRLSQAACYAPPYLAVERFTRVMPLTPLPETNTKRYSLIYTVGPNTHRMQSRCSDLMDDSTAIGHMQAIAAALAPSFCSNGTFVGVEVALSGSNVHNVVPGLTPVSGGAAAITGINFPYSQCIAGRSPSGRKVKVFVYGMTGVALSTTWEEDPLTNADLQGFQGLLNSQSDFWLAIDATKPVWYFRCTQGFNDHYVAAARA